MLTHDFMLIPESNSDRSDYSAYRRGPGGIRIHDDLVTYLWDTLAWIPTINPTILDAGKGTGLNYHGVTVIRGSSADKASRIFSLWADILGEGPETVELTGAFEWEDGQDIANGRYALIKMNRDEIVASLRTVAEYLRKAAGGGFCVLHFGV